MSKLVSVIYKIARSLNDLEKISSGSAKKIVTRAKNKVIGREIGKRIFRPFRWK